MATHQMEIHGIHNTAHHGHLVVVVVVVGSEVSE